MLDQENQPNLPNETESDNPFLDKTVVKKDNIYSDQEECLDDVSLGGFSISQLANKLECLAFITPHTPKIRPKSSITEKDSDLKESPDSTDSDSGRTLTSNDSSIYWSFVTESVENQQLDSLDFLSTVCNDEINKSGCNIDSMHENLALVTLDLVGSDFEDSSHSLTTYSLSNKSLSEKTFLNKSHNFNPDLNHLALKQNISTVDGIETDIKVQSNIYKSKKKNFSVAGPIYMIAEGFSSSAVFKFRDLEVLESAHSLNDEEFPGLTLTSKSIYVEFDSVLNKANQESNSRLFIIRKEIIENLQGMDKTIPGSSPQSSEFNKSLNDKIKKLECEGKNLKNECIANKKKIKDLTNALVSVTKSKAQISIVIGEYEKTFSDMIAKEENVHKEYEARIAHIEDKRAKMKRHLQNSGMAFNDVLEKYNSSKQVIKEMKENEIRYKNCLKEFDEYVKQCEDKYIRLKMHATEQMKKASKEINEKERLFEMETSKMRILNKRLEVKVKTLQESLDRKDVENTELTNLCEELIGKFDKK